MATSSLGRQGTGRAVGSTSSTLDEEEAGVERRTEARTGIPAEELGERRERLLEHVGQQGLSGYVLFGAD
jgi:hypothetical protein